MPRFFAPKENFTEDAVTITGQDAHHIKDVLRMKPGEVITVSDGEGSDCACEIRAISASEVSLSILSKEASKQELRAVLTLFQGIPKGDKLETVIKMGTELGAAAFFPVEMKRCVVKWDAKKEGKKLERLQAIAESAAKQSGRGRIPEVKEALPFKQALAWARENCDVILMPYEKAEGMEDTRKILMSLEKDMRIGIFIGPEGGFEEAEAEEAINCGAKAITLGPRILRTETAGPAVLSILGFLLT